jgi:TonB family protein
MTRCGRIVVGDAQFFVRSAAPEPRNAASAPLVLSDDEASQVLRIRALSKPLREFYPDLLRQQRIEGKVLCRITINPNGRVIHAELVKHSSSRALGAAALRVASAYQFDNSLREAVITTLPIKFAINAEPN